jgi:hypothetical protein
MASMVFSAELEEWQIRDEGNRHSKFCEIIEELLEGESVPYRRPGRAVGGASAAEGPRRLIGFVLVNHPDGFGGAFFSAYAASLAVIIIDFHRDGLLDDPLGAIHPAKKAGLPPCF